MDDRNRTISFQYGILAFLTIMVIAQIYSNSASNWQAQEEMLNHTREARNHAKKAQVLCATATGWKSRFEDHETTGK